MDIKKLGAGALFTIGVIIALKLVADRIGGGVKSVMDRV